MSFGSTLARYRRDRGWSQEALALRADLSQRHISFLETGRSRPGQASLHKLFHAMALKGWEQRALLAELAPAQRVVEADTPSDAVMARLVERLTLWPGYVFRPDGTLVLQNNAMARLLDAIVPDKDLWHAAAHDSGPNIYDIVMHPAGLTRWMENPDEVVPETMRRLRIEAAQDARLLPTVARLERYPAVQLHDRIEVQPPAVLIERYRWESGSFAIISVLSHLASPGEPELGALRIESFVPADSDSDETLRRLIAS